MPPRVQSRISDHLGARAQYIWTRQFGQHYASQSLTNAADAQQKIAFRLQVAIIVDRQCDGFVDCSELAREVRDRRIGQGLSLRVHNAAVLAILPFRQARDDAGSNRLQLPQSTVGLRSRRPRLGLEQFAILANVRRIDPVSFVATQLGAREVSKLSGIDDADHMTGLVQRTRNTKTIAPGRFQTGVNSSDLLGNEPIQKMVPPVRCICKALRAHLGAAGDARVERILGNVDTQYSVDHCLILPSRLCSTSSASSNLVRRIYALARPRIPSSLNSGAWKNGA